MAATGQVLKLYRNHFGQNPVDTTGEFDQLDVSAALSPDRRKLTVAIVNPTYQEYEVSIDLEPARSSSCRAYWQITAPEEGSFNEPGKPEVVKIEQKKADVDMRKIQISALSVYLFELNLQ
jgi:alpha-N-arabinofuranosidase